MPSRTSLGLTAVTADRLVTHLRALLRALLGRNDLGVGTDPLLADATPRHPLGEVDGGADPLRPAMHCRIGPGDDAYCRAGLRVERLQVAAWRANWPASPRKLKGGLTPRGMILLPD